MNLKLVIFIIMFNLFSAPAAMSESKGAWELYVIPQKYTINSGEELKLKFGFTGYGDIDPIKLKIVACTEANTVIKYQDKTSFNNSDTYTTFTLFPNLNNPAYASVFTTKQPQTPNYSIALTTDYDSHFDALKLFPKSPGNKKLTLIATYFIKGDGWHTTKYDFEYHVNTLAEEYQTLITIISIVCAVLAIGFLPSFGERCLLSLKNKFKKI